MNYAILSPFLAALAVVVHNSVKFVSSSDITDTIFQNTNAINDNTFKSHLKLINNGTFYKNFLVNLFPTLTLPP